MRPKTGNETCAIGRVLLTAACVSMLSGCGTYQMLREPRSQKVCTEVTFAAPVDVRRMCEERGVAAAGLVACASIEAENGWHWIVVPRPVDFNDTKSVELLGHELMHNLGGSHR